jgi:hypothetical protein
VPWRTRPHKGTLHDSRGLTNRHGGPPQVATIDATAAVRILPGPMVPTRPSPTSRRTQPRTTRRGVSDSRELGCREVGSGAAAVSGGADDVDGFGARQCRADLRQAGHRHRPGPRHVPGEVLVRFADVDHDCAAGACAANAFMLTSRIGICHFLPIPRGVSTSATLAHPWRLRQGAGEPEAGATAPRGRASGATRRRWMLPIPVGVLLRLEESWLPRRWPRTTSPRPSTVRASCWWISGPAGAARTAGSRRCPSRPARLIWTSCSARSTPRALPGRRRGSGRGGRASHATFERCSQRSSGGDGAAGP